MTIESQELKAVVKVLKKKFSNLTAEEAIDLATEVLIALENAT